MATLWRILYGFIFIFGKSSFEGIEAQEIVSEKTKNAQGVPNKELPRVYHRNSVELKNYPKEIYWSGDVLGHGMKTIEDNTGYRDSDKSAIPVSFIYHKTLKKMQGKACKIKDENGMLVDSRIRVSPIGYEPLEHLDFPLMSNLSDLNGLNDLGGSQTRDNDDIVSIAKLRGFLKEAIRKSNEKSVKSRKSRFANITKICDKDGLKGLNSNNDIVKLLVQKNPFQVSSSQGGIEQNFEEKNCNRKFSPEGFIMGISNDPFFSTNQAIADENNDNVKNKQESNEGVNNILNQNLSKIDKSKSNGNKVKLSRDKNLLDQIHQSAEETFFKNALNELISDIPQKLGLSTIRSVDNIGLIESILKNSDHIKEIESHVKFAKHGLDETTNDKDINPCVKIRVKNGPVTLTFLSEARRATTRKPFTDPSNIPVFKMSDETNSNKSILTNNESLFKNVLSGITDEMNSGEFSKYTGGKGNLSCYYTGNEVEGIANNFLGVNPQVVVNESKIADDEGKNLYNQNSSKIVLNFSNDRIVTPVQNVNVTNCTRSNKLSVGKVNSDHVKYTPKSNYMYTRDKAVDFFKPRGPVALACPFGLNNFLFPNYINGVHRYGPSKHLFLTRTGQGAYQFAHDADRLRLAAHLSRTNGDSRFRYVPKLYYNDLVVSKGLVGQHPPKEDTSSAVLSEGTLKKMEILNILKFYLDSLSPERNFTLGRNKESLFFNPMIKSNRKYFINW